MILDRGVCRIRSMSASVRGCASGSATAAACRSSSVIASSRLQSCCVVVMISPSFTGFCLTRRNYPYPALSESGDNKQQTPINHTDCGEANFAPTMPVILEFDSKGVGEHAACRLKAYPMLLYVGGGFLVIPLEGVIFHTLLPASSYVNHIPARSEIWDRGKQHGPANFVGVPSLEAGWASARYRNE